MIEYLYLARSDDGELIRGHLVAADQQAVQKHLEAKGLKYIESRTVDPLDFAAAASDQAGGTAACRLPLEVTVAALAEEMGDQRLAKVAEQLAAKSEQDKPTEQVLGELHRWLPIEIRGTLQVGADSGDLAGVLERYSRQRLASQHARRRIRAALTYPIIILSILVPLLLFLSLFVVPFFRDIFTEFDLVLPAVTVIILRASEQMPKLVIGLLLLVLGIPIALRVLGGRWLFHRLRAAMPILGRMWVCSAQRDFAASLASFISLRMTLVEAVAQTGSSISDRNLGRACRNLCGQLEQVHHSPTASIDRSILIRLWSLLSLGAKAKVSCRKH